MTIKREDLDRQAVDFSEIASGRLPHDTEPAPASAGRAGAASTVSAGRNNTEPDGRDTSALCTPRPLQGSSY